MIGKIIRALCIVGFFVAFLVFGIRSCSEHTYPYPSEAYYVNDYADVLDTATEDFLIGESTALYNDTKNIDEIGGTQIVFATFAVDSDEEIATYDKNALYREWKIGKNNMGVLVIMFFTPHTEDDLPYFDLRQLQVEVGYHTEPYYTSLRLNQYYADTIGTYLPSDTLTFAGDTMLDLGVASFMNDLLNMAYGTIYNEPDQVYDQTTFDDWYLNSYLEDYVYHGSMHADEPLNYFTYTLRYFGASTNGTLFFVFLGLTVLAGGSVGILKAGGGSSGGGGLFKRR